MQLTFGDAEDLGQRKRTRREVFLAEMDQVVPWPALLKLIEPHYPKLGRPGRQPYPLETMLRVHFLQQWYALSDPGMEEALYDTPVMRRFAGLGGLDTVPDETTILNFRRLLETHDLARQMLEQVNTFLSRKGLSLRGGTIVDATIIAAPSSTKNGDGRRDPEMHQTRKGNQWYFGMKAHAGVDAGTGLVHSVSVTGANVHDLDEITHLVRADDQVVYADAGYQGAAKRPEIVGDEHLAGVEWRIAARKGVLKAMHPHEQLLESRKASVRAKVEHVFLIVKRDFGLVKTRYRGLAKNLNQLQVAMASANLLMLARATTIETRLKTAVATG